MEPYESRESAILEVSPRVLALAVAAPMAIGLAVTALVYAARGLDSAIPALVYSCVIAALVTISTLTYHRRRTVGRVRIAQEGISVDGVLAFPRSKIVSAAPVRWKFSVPVVRLKLSGRVFPVDIAVRSDAEVGEVERALGFDASRLAATYVLPWPAVRRGARSGLAIVGAMFGSVALMIASLLAMAAFGVRPAEVAGEWGLLLLALYAATLIFVVRAGRMHVVVGTDGVAIRQWGRRRFLSHDAIVAIERWAPDSVRGAMSEGVDLVLRDGERIGLFTAREAMRAGIFDRDVFESRLAEARRARLSPGGRVDVSLLERGANDTRRWVAALRALGVGAERGFREAAARPEGLWSLLSDPAAPPVTRAAAAIALGAGGEEPRARIAALAGAAASPALKRALEGAARNDEAALEESLAALEAEDVETRARR